jgi:hypothetical protein
VSVRALPGTRTRSDAAMTIPSAVVPWWGASLRPGAGAGGDGAGAAPQPLATFAKNAIRLLKKTLCGYADAGSLWA